MNSPDDFMKMLGSKFFWCRFIKKDGTERVGTFIIGVGRKNRLGTDDGGTPYVDHAHLVVWDTKLGEYRKIAVDRIQEIRALGMIITTNSLGHFTWRSR